MKMNKIKYIASITIALISCSGMAQQITKEVVVTSNFKPEVDKVEKINRLPEVDDTVTIKPEIDIEVMPSRIETPYQIREIKPAKIVSNPLDKLYNSYVKLGVGNYLTPLGEFNIHNLRSNKYAYGAYAYHKSSNRKDIELADNLNVSDNYSKNNIGGFGKMFLNDVILEGDVSLNTRTIHFYGINPDNALTNDNLPNDIFNKQRYSDLGFNGRLLSNTPDSSSLHYQIGLNMKQFWDKEKNKETLYDLNGRANYLVSSFLIGADIDFSYIKFNPFVGDDKFNVTWRIDPSVKKRKKEWEFKIGARFAHNRSDTTLLFIHPDVYLRFYIIPEVLQTYFGATGKLESNSYSEFTLKNPYIDPGLNETVTTNTNHRLIGFAGLIGKLGSKGGFKIDARFDSMEDNYYFVLIDQSPSAPENLYIIRTDDSDLITLSGEINYDPLSNLNFLISGKYNNYQMVEENKPWHKPAVEATFSTNYSFHDKIFSKFDILYYGKRYGLSPQQANEVIDERTVELAPIWDVNLGVEYKYSKVLSFYVDLHNILGNKYEFWQNYPIQGFNLMLGLTYKL